jgi:hypothetical protein
MPLINFNIAPHVAYFLAIAIYTKDISVLILPPAGFILRDVVFDESLFPFANLHNNAGARYTSEVLLLLEPTQSQANSELPMNNDPPVSCLPCPILFPPQVP